MLAPYTTRCRRLVFLTLVGLTCGVSGCLPAAVVWLPDSSGFIYVASHKTQLTRLVHFDLATKTARARREIALDGQPGLGPDGKRIAVANYSGGGPARPDGKDGEKERKPVPSTLQVILYDSQGKELLARNPSSGRNPVTTLALPYRPFCTGHRRAIIS